MGINQDLHLQGNQFSSAASAFFIAYLVAEVPTGKCAGFMDEPSCERRLHSDMRDDSNRRDWESLFKASGVLCTFEAHWLTQSCGDGTGYLLQRLPTAKYFAANVVLWGITTASTAACQTSVHLIVVRVFLGIFEVRNTHSLICVLQRLKTYCELGCYWSMPDRSHQYV